MEATIELMPLPERMKALRERLGMTQEEMAARLRISRNYYWQLENGTKPAGPKIERDIELMERSPRQPSNPAGDVMRNVQITVPRYIPVVSLAQAGDILVAWENFPMHFRDKVPTDLGDPHALAVKVQGDSMEPHFFEGDRVIISPAHELQDFDLVIARFAEDRGTVFKLYQRSSDGSKITLSSYNTAYEAKTYSAEEFDTIVAVVSVVKDVSIKHLRRRM